MPLAFAVPRSDAVIVAGPLIGLAICLLSLCLILLAARDDERRIGGDSAQRHPPLVRRALPLDAASPASASLSRAAALAAASRGSTVSGSLIDAVEYKKGPDRVTTFHIAMGQGLVVGNLNAHAISTGHPPMSNSLQSCTAVIMVNGVSGVGGMYHYPAGPFAANHEATDILENMWQTIQPREAAVIRGGTQAVNANARLGPVANTGATALQAWLHERLAPAQVQSQAAQSGYVRTWVHAFRMRFSFQQPLTGTQEVFGHPEGVHSFGLMYGEDRLSYAHLAY